MPRRHTEGQFICIFILIAKLCRYDSIAPLPHSDDCLLLLKQRHRNDGLRRVHTTIAVAVSFDIISTSIGIPFSPHLRVLSTLTLARLLQLISFRVEAWPPVLSMGEHLPFVVLKSRRPADADGSLHVDASTCPVSKKIQ